MDSPWILTASGRKFHYLEFDPDEFIMEDAATAISRICRYSGHLSEEYEDSIYSVAQHSVYVHDLLVRINSPKRVLPWAITHDIPEGYWLDLVAPLKSVLPNYVEMEERSAAVMRKKYNIPYDAEVERHVKWADTQLMYAEADKLLCDPDGIWRHAIPHTTLDELDPDFTLWSPKKAKYRLLETIENVKQYMKG